MDRRRQRRIANPSVAGSNPVVPSFAPVISCAVLWCNWLALWTLNPAIRVQIPVGPLFYITVYEVKKVSFSLIGSKQDSYSF